MRVSKSTILFLALLVCPDGSLPAQPPCRQRSTVVSVVDEEGSVVTDVTQRSIRVEYLKQPVQVRSLVHKPQTVRIVILLDASGSMGQPPEKSNLALAAAAHFIEAAPPDASLALLTFADRVEVMADFSEERSSMLRKVRAGVPKMGIGPTVLLDAILHALRLLAPPRPGDAILVISDGADSASKLTEREVEGALLSTGTRFFAFLVASVGTGGRNLSPEELAGPPMLRDLAAVTGGDWVESVGFYPGEKEKRALAIAMGALSQLVAQYYRLDVELPRDVDKPRDWKIEILDEQGRKNKNLRVLYPRKLFPCIAANSENR